MKLDDIGYSSILGYAISKTRELCGKLELSTEYRCKVSMIDDATNVMRHAAFDTVELTNFWDQVSDTFDKFDVVDHEI